MKKFDMVLFVLAMVALVVILVVRPFEQKGTEYPKVFTVVEVHADRVVLVDFLGEEWQIDNEDDWFTGDVAAAIMNDMGTEDITDDQIVAIQCDGWRNDWDRRQER